ncbi:MobF family relaxase [Candidatus Rariloculus sp.]|uniref:MobF family relaxase n=1 Tax=Candidatus Rariloculus sp. TaxID=3101265 RepID=UPI003D0AAF8B
MVASIGAIASASQGVSYYERDGYYAQDDPAHKEASAWTGKGADALNLTGPVEPELFKKILEGHVPDGTGHRLGRREKDGTVLHRPGRDITLSAPKSVSLAALIGGDRRIVSAHDKAVQRTLGWVEKNVVETRLRDPETGRMVRAGGQKMVAATFRHDTSRNLDPQLHTHAVIANMLQGEDGKWRTMANEKLYRSKMLLGALYRGELAGELEKLGYGIEKTHADGRFEIAGVSRKVIEAFSTRRAAIVAAMAQRGLGGPDSNPRLAERAALMTRAHKRDVDHGSLREHWREQAAELGFDAAGIAAEAMEKSAGREDAPGIAPPAAENEYTGRAPNTAEQAVAWAVAHLSEREAVFSRTGVLTAALTWQPGAVSIQDAVDAVSRLARNGTLHAANSPVPGDSLTTDKAVADERETIALMHGGQGRGAMPVRGRAVDKALRNGPLTDGQKAAVKLILSEKDRVIGVQGYAGTGKTTMLKRARALLKKRGFEVRGLAPSASAAQTLAAESGIESETLQRFLARNAGVAAGRLTRKGAREMRAAFKKTVLVVDEGSLASTVQTRNLLRIARELRLPRVVLVGDGKQLDAVDAGKPFVQLQQAGMKTATMDQIMRQREPELKAAVEASLGGDIKKAFEKLGSNVAEVKPDNLAGAAAARWLKLSPQERKNAGLMAPSHALRVEINEIVRERLVRDGQVKGPGIQTERLVSRGYTHAEKTMAENYAPGDVVAFHRPYKRLGVEKGDELRVEEIDRDAGTVNLRHGDGGIVPWVPHKLAARTGGAEVYRSESMELRQGDRIRWTRNDNELGLINSQTAEVARVKNGTVTFALEDGRTLGLKDGAPQLRHIDRAWASTVHAFQGRTVDTVIAAMEANHPHLTTQKTLYVEISRARDRAELVTDNRDALRERLQAVTGERISALEAVEPEGGKTVEPASEIAPDRGREEPGSTTVERMHVPENVREPHGIEMEM